MMEPNHPSNDQVLRILANQVETLVKDGVEMRTILRDLTTAVARLAVIEERQGAAREAVERSFKEIQALQMEVAGLDREINALIERKDSEIRALVSGQEVRLKTLEIAEPTNRATSEMVRKVTWLAVAAVIGALLTLVVSRPPQMVITPSATVSQPLPRQQQGEAQ